MRAKRRLVRRWIRQILESGDRHPENLCSLPRPLYGSARVGLLGHLDRHNLVRITNWASHSAAGLEIGTIREYGRQALSQGWYL